ncbi:MAG: hypothetical protein AB7S86_14275 [Hydrogenophaga sp.]|uniref:hypothetical protein n=1 Tax=Hydrogenophaga sp. TaxID=1904254 RepID=UPI003D09F9F7
MSGGDTRPPLGTLLLIEPDGLLRSTVASVCRDMQLVQVQQATSVAMAEPMLKSGLADGLLISLAEGESSLACLSRLRAGGFGCDASLPVAVMAREGDPALIKQLKALEVRRLLLQPYRLRDVIQTVEQLWSARAGACV